MIKENPLPNTQIRHITQFQDGRVKISFERASSSSKFFDISSSESLDLGRVSQIPSIINLPYKEQPHIEKPHTITLICQESLTFLTQNKHIYTQIYHQL